MGEMAVMGQRGDNKHMWNPRDEDEVGAMRKMFDDLVKKKRFLAFKVKRDGEPGERISEFDPDAGKIIIAPPMAGGAPLSLARSEEEIDRVMNWAAESTETGSVRYPGMTYEQGVESALLWVTGQSDEEPDAE